MAVWAEVLKSAESDSSPDSVLRIGDGVDAGVGNVCSGVSSDRLDINLSY